MSGAVDTFVAFLIRVAVRISSRTDRLARCRNVGFCIQGTEIVTNRGLEVETDLSPAPEVFTVGKSMDDDGPILVVDDDAVLRRALTRILRSDGHRVVEAASGNDALEAAREHAPALVVLDYAMPGMDGETVLHQMREEHAESTPPALLLTASGQQQARAEAMGAAGGLCKPFRVEDLLAAVRRHRRSDA